MPALIPAQLSSAAQAEAAISAYLASSRPALGSPFDPVGPTTRRRLLTAQYRRDGLLNRLDRDPGPGPILLAGGSPIGRPVLAESRQPAERIELPRQGDYGLYSEDPLGELGELLASIEISRALAARAARIADVELERGRSRQAERFDAEAGALIALGSHLEGVIPALGGLFLQLWRGQAARSAPPEPARPPLRPVTLRKAIP